MMVQVGFFRAAATTTLAAILVSLPTLCHASSARSPSSWNPPTETVISGDDKPEGPAPTESPLQARYYDYDEAICGYETGGLYATGLSCYEGSCITSGDFWGCCASIWRDDDTCNTKIYTTCIEYDLDSYTSATDTLYAFETDTSAIGCYSYTYNYYTDIDISTYTFEAFCATLLSTRGTNTFSSFVCSSVNTALVISDASTTSNSESITRSTNDPGSASQTLSAEDVAKEQPRMIGAIVGGVIGGIILVGAGTFAAVYFWLKMYPDAEPSAPYAAAPKTPNASAAVGPLEPINAATEPPVAAPQPVHTVDSTGNNNKLESSEPKPS